DRPLLVVNDFEKRLALLSLEEAQEDGGYRLDGDGRCDDTLDDHRRLAARRIAPAESRLPLDRADHVVCHPLDRDRPYASGRNLRLEARRHAGHREVRALDSERGAVRVLHGENVDDAYALLHRTEIVRLLWQDSVRSLGGQGTQWEEKKGEGEE